MRRLTCERGAGVTYLLQQGGQQLELFVGTQVGKRRRVLDERYQSQDQRLGGRLPGRHHRAGGVARCGRRTGRRRRRLPDADPVQPRPAVDARALGALRGLVDRALGSRPAGEADPGAASVAPVVTGARVGGATERAAVRSDVVELGACRRRRLARRPSWTRRRTSGPPRTHVLTVSTPDPAPSRHQRYFGYDFQVTVTASILSRGSTLK